MQERGKACFVRATSKPAHSSSLSPGCELSVQVKNTPTRLAYLWQSSGCESFYWQSVGRRTQKGTTNNFKYGPGQGPAVPQQVGGRGG